MSTSNDFERVQELSDRASRQWHKGNHKKALVVIREACLLAGDDARLWTLYGAWLGGMGRISEAETAFKQAVFFRKSAHDVPRQRVTEHLLARLRQAA